ncbi:unknown [Clostridium sp. CAG:269]|nr:unknown [Clostridium sp. CAG:269]
MREETGLDVKELKYKGNMIIEYPNRIFDLDVFLATESEGEPQEFEENTSEWIEIQELLQKEKILSNIIVLDSFFIKGLIDDNYNFKMNVKVDEQENILSVNYELNKNV